MIAKYSDPPNKERRRPPSRLIKTVGVGRAPKLSSFKGQSCWTDISVRHGNSKPEYIFVRACEVYGR